jgi:hypothetical protein
MVGKRDPFTAEPAPCGRSVGGECYRDDDGEGLVVYDQHYDCGCQRTRHEYHDGTVTTTTVRHGRRPGRRHAGKLVSEEHSEHPV